MPNKFKVTLYQDVFKTRGGNYQDDNVEFPKSHSIDSPKRGFSFFWLKYTHVKNFLLDFPSKCSTFETESCREAAESLLWCTLSTLMNVSCSKRGVILVRGNLLVLSSSGAAGWAEFSGDGSESRTKVGKLRQEGGNFSTTHWHARCARCAVSNLCCRSASDAGR